MARPDSARLSGEFWRFWTASALSNLGDGIRLTALPLLALTLTDSALAISAVTALIGLPWLIVGPLGGVIVDRFDRRRLMIGGQIVRGSAVGVLAIWVAAATPPLALVYVVTFIVGAGEVIVDTSSQAAIPHLAPAGPGGLELANGRLVAAQTLLDQVVGAPVGAALFVIGTALPFAFDTATFIVSALLLTLVSTPLQPPRAIPTAPSSVRAELVEGFHVVWTTPLLRGLAIGVGLINAVLSSTFAVLVIFVIDELDGTETGYGIMLGVAAVGGFLGALSSSRIVKRIGRRTTIVATTVIVGATSASMALVVNIVMLAVLFFVAMSAVVVFNVAGQSLRQAASPPALLGRVVASFRVIGLAGAPVGAILGGVLATAVGIRPTYAIAGAFAVVPVAVIITATRHMPPADPSLD